MCKKIEIQVPNFPFQQGSKKRAIKNSQLAEGEKRAEINQIENRKTIEKSKKESSLTRSVKLIGIYLG